MMPEGHACVRIGQVQFPKVLSNRRHGTVPLRFGGGQQKFAAVSRCAPDSDMRIGIELRNHPSVLPVQQAIVPIRDIQPISEQERTEGFCVCQRDDFCFFSCKPIDGDVIRIEEPTGTDAAKRRCIGGGQNAAVSERQIVGENPDVLIPDIHGRRADDSVTRVERQGDIGMICRFSAAQVVVDPHESAAACRVMAHGIPQGAEIRGIFGGVLRKDGHCGSDQPTEFPQQIVMPPQAVVAFMRIAVFPQDALEII